MITIVCLRSDNTSTRVHSNRISTQAKDKGLWEKCELDLKACQLLLERERQERKQEQEDMEREMQQALRAVGEKAVHFVEEEIMRFNSTALELDSKLRQAEKQRDEAVSALSRANGVGQQHCNECRLRGLARHLFEKTIDGLLSRALTSWRQVVLSSPSRDKNVDVGGHAHRQDIKTQVPETPPKLMYGLIASVSSFCVILPRAASCTHDIFLSWKKFFF